MLQNKNALLSSVQNYAAANLPSATANPLSAAANLQSAAAIFLLYCNLAGTNLPSHFNRRHVHNGQPGCPLVYPYLYLDGGCAGLPGCPPPTILTGTEMVAVLVSLGTPPSILTCTGMVAVLVSLGTPPTILTFTAMVSVLVSMGALPMSVLTCTEMVAVLVSLGTPPSIAST